MHRLRMYNVRNSMHAFSEQSYTRTQTTTRPVVIILTIYNVFYCVVSGKITKSVRRCEMPFIYFNSLILWYILFVYIYILYLFILLKLLSLIFEIKFRK